MIPITVEACNKDHWLLGIDMLKVDTTKLINSMKAEENNIRLLRGYRACVRLKENYHLGYMESRKLLIFILPLEVGKLKNDTARNTRKSFLGG